MTQSGGHGSGTESSGQLPPSLAIFPLAGVLLLPGGRLPLNIFEPRYLAMVRDAMASHRMIGMVQPTDPRTRDWAPPVYPVACAGRITSFTENDDGRYQIILTGISRFRIAEELSVTTLYRQVTADWSPYSSDAEAPAGAVERQRLLQGLREFLELHKIPAEWQAIERAPDEPLINTLAMICPFAPNEKQALLEADDLAKRAELMTALIEMAVLNRRAAGGQDPDRRPLH